MAAKTWGVHCAVRWCVCLVKPESQYCAVHATRGKDYRPEEPWTGATAACDTCDGTGECVECDGDGTHMCDHERCNDEHDCGACDGSGECPDCQPDDENLDGFDKRYIAFAFDAGWVPPVLINYPWDSR